MSNTSRGIRRFNFVKQNPRVYAAAVEVDQRMPRRTSIKIKAARMLLVVVGTIVGLAAAEVLLRVVGYEGMEERVTTVFDDHMGPIPATSWVNTAVFDPRQSDDVVINTTRVAFDKEEKTRVLFIGDSGTFGAGVYSEEAFPIVFGEEARVRSSQDLEVINAGVVGIDNVTEYLLLRDRLVKLEPDIVILGLFMANDINFNLGNAHLLRGEQTTWWRILGHLRSRSALAHFGLYQLLAVSSKYRLFGDPEPYTFGEAMRPLQLVEASGLHMLEYLGGEVATYRKRYSPLMRDGFTLLMDLMGRFKTLSETHSFQFVVVVIPTASQIDGRLEMFTWPDPLDQLRQHGASLSSDELDFQKPLRIVGDVCSVLEVVCIDPTPDLRQIGATRAILPRDDHLSAEGHRIVAASLIRHFNRHSSRFETCPECPKRRIGRCPVEIDWKNLAQEAGHAQGRNGRTSNSFSSGWLRPSSVQTARPAFSPARAATVWRRYWF